MRVLSAPNGHLATGGLRPPRWGKIMTGEVRAEGLAMLRGGGMRSGGVLPRVEIGGDVGAVAAYAQGAGELGFSHILAYDHVVGADPEVHKGWNGPYDVHTTFHEPLVLYGYLAAVTSM